MSASSLVHLHYFPTLSFEPGSNFVFPEGEIPEPKPSSFDTLEGVAVPMSEFMALTEIPILIVYGDNIPAEPSDVPTQDAWRVRRASGETPSTATAAT